MEITVITAAYNCEATISETIESVLNQTFKNWRLIIFDDGSADSTAQIAREYAAKDERIKYFCHPDGKNKGLPAVLQKAAGLAKTEYIAFLECDDIWEKDYLKEKVSFLLKNPQAEIIYNKVKCFGDENRVKKLTLLNNAAQLYVKFLNPFGRPYDLNFALYNFNPIPTFSCVLMKTALAEHCGFCAPFAPQADYWLWARLSFKHKFYFLEKELTLWRLTCSSYTMKSRSLVEEKKKMRKEVKALYKKNSPSLYPFKAGLSEFFRLIFSVSAFLLKPLAKTFLRIKQ